MTDREVMKLALEALEWWEAEFGGNEAPEPAITALRERLAQPEQEPLQFKCTIVDDAHPNGVPLEQWGKQPEQEPVAWPCVIAEADFEQNTITVEMQCSDYKVSAGQHWLYTAPPQRKKLPPQTPCLLTQAENKMFRFGWLECEASHNIKGEA